MPNNRFRLVSDQSENYHLMQGFDMPKVTSHLSETLHRSGVAMLLQTELFAFRMKLT